MIKGSALKIPPKDFVLWNPIVFVLTHAVRQHKNIGFPKGLPFGGIIRAEPLLNPKLEE